MRVPRTVQAPRIDPLVLKNLFDGDSTLLAPGAELDDLRLAGIRGERIDVSGSNTSGCMFEDVVADEFSIATSRVVETRFVTFGVSLFRMARSVFRDVEFDGGRNSCWTWRPSSRASQGFSSTRRLCVTVGGGDAPTSGW